MSKQFNFIWSTFNAKLHIQYVDDFDRQYPRSLCGIAFEDFNLLPGDAIHDRPICKHCQQCKQGKRKVARIKVKK